MMKRRDFVKTTGFGGTSILLTSRVKVPFMQNRISTLSINPAPKFELSPWLYMQFMEPSGVTDSYVEAAWDHQTDKWRAKELTIG